MKKYNIPSLIHRFLPPALLILLGLLLVFNPDSASALLAKILGWALLVMGGGFVVAAVLDRVGLPGKVLGAIVCLCIGGYLVRNPLVLAAGIGRFVGILLAIWGIQEIIEAKKLNKSLLFPVIGTAIGAVLVFLPMTTTRLVWMVCGLVVLVIGVVMLLERLRERKHLNGPEDPNIIDAL